MRRDEVVEGTRIVNPGALHRAASYSVAVLDPSAASVRFIAVPRG